MICRNGITLLSLFVLQILSLNILNEGISSRNNPFRSRGASLARKSHVSPHFVNRTKERFKEEFGSRGLSASPGVLSSEAIESIVTPPLNFHHHSSNDDSSFHRFSRNNRSFLRSPSPSFLSRLHRFTPPPSSGVKSLSKSILTSVVSSSLNSENEEEELSGKKAGDPCLPDNYRIIFNESRRSFNHQLNFKEHQPICDSQLISGWYRFDSPAGNYLAMKCPGGNYCGTQIPVWMKGRIPNVSEGISEARGCINEGRECCVSEVPIRVKNCSSYVVYHLDPTPSCNMGYCVGDEVLCSEGLTSPNGYTPCTFPLEIQSVELIQETTPLHDEIIFSCLPKLNGVISEKNVVLSVEWWTDGRKVYEDSFNYNVQKSSKLEQKFWKLGQTIRCTVVAKHSVISTLRSNQLSSKEFFAGIEFDVRNLSIQEGGHPVNITLRVSIPILCNNRIHISQVCCIGLDIHFIQDNSLASKCRDNRPPFSKIQTCERHHEICSSSLSQSTHFLSLIAPDDGLFTDRNYNLVHMNVKTLTSNTFWQNYNLPSKKIKVYNNKLTSVCTCFGNEVLGFDGARYVQKESGNYTIYKNAHYEIQVLLKPCSLKESCICIINVQMYNGDLRIIFDLCSQGHLTVFGKTSTRLPEGLELLSLDEGREYQLYLPSGTMLSLGYYLNHVKIYPSRSDINTVTGLCGPLTALKIETKTFCSLNDCPKFSSNMIVSANQSLERNVSQNAYLTNGLDKCYFPSQKSCFDESVSVLQEVFKLGASRDIQKSLKYFSNENEVDELYLPVNPYIVDPTPVNGWTIDEADKYCREIIVHRQESSLHKCVSLPGVHLNLILERCASDLTYSGDYRISDIFLVQLQQLCRSSLFRHNTFWNQSEQSPPSTLSRFLCINNCSGHGKCHLGHCICLENYIGSDCSVHLLTDSPRILSLENEGLCDVQTKPCKELAILASGLARTESLNCNFLIYKIRGVASKQLVYDKSITLPAKYISYDRLLCPIPNLDIHDPNSLTNFDLKGNTDHTRLYIKVFVRYDVESPQSLPLDLLLYDSTCWNCTTVECTAKHDDNCFFASGSSSSIQVFRLGKSVTSSRKNSEDFDDKDVCTLLKDTGECDNKIFRYYYNSIERRCKLFVYGGCKGNDNNFLSEALCLQKCGDEPTTSLDTLNESTTKYDICSENKDEGICPGNVPRFFFDKEAGRCLLFSYGGCGGNSNNFETEVECVDECGGPSGNIYETALIPLKSICTLPLSRGACQATLRRFYFDVNEGCKLFIFGGCQGNANNFETMEDCTQNCSEELENQKGGEKPFVLSTTPSSPRVFSSGLRHNVCNLPKTFGSGSLITIRFYYDSKSNNCKKFLFSGNGSNGNNFVSGERCILTCAVYPIKGSSYKQISSSSSSSPPSSSSSPPSSRSSFTQNSVEKSEKEIKLSLLALLPEETSFLSPPSSFRRPEMKELKIGSALTRSVENYIFHSKDISNSLARKSLSSSPSEFSSKSDGGDEKDDEKEFSKPNLHRIRIRVKSKKRLQINEGTLDRHRHRLRLRRPEKVKIRTQTSRSVVMTSFGNSFENYHEILHVNITRASPSGVKRYPSNSPSGVYQGNHGVKSGETDKHSISDVGVIRSFCTFPPSTSFSKDCLVKQRPFYYYNMTTTSCELFSASVTCGQSRNRFISSESCFKSCIVEARGFATDPTNRSIIKLNT